LPACIGLSHQGNQTPQQVESEMCFLFILFGHAIIFLIANQIEEASSVKVSGQRAEHRKAWFVLSLV
jgi:hypothetical protein